MTTSSRRNTRTRKRSFAFDPLYVSEPPIPLAKTDFPDDAELVVIERGGLERAFLVREISYHHMAQGELAGEPYLVSF